MNLVKKILSAVKSGHDLSTIQALEIGYDECQNELLMFIKPEIFQVSEASCIEKSLELILTKLNEFEVRISGLALVGGRVLEQKEAMDRHYGAINILSKSATKTLSQADQIKIYEAVNVPGQNPSTEYALFGGHEFLAVHPEYTPHSLDKLWFTKPSIKIRSGFYVQSYEGGADHVPQGEKFILVNGFHPAQLAHFTEESHRIVLMLLHTNTDWDILRNQMIGDTFPEKADKGSIRGCFYENAGAYGFDSVSIANNGVHLSAGPFEAMFEINNFFGSLLDLEPQPLILKKMIISQGLGLKQALDAMTNPQVRVKGDQTDLFDATEHLNTDPAVDLYKLNFGGDEISE